MTDPSPASGLAAADSTLPERVAVVGAGVIGAAWTARWALCGADVAVADPSPAASRHVESTLDAARTAWRRLGLLPSDSAVAPHTEGTVTVVAPEAGYAEAADGAELICECVPERLALKRTVYAEIEDAATSDAVIASSTSGIRPSDLQAEMRHPERLVVGHPFNPVYLLPLVEVAAGAHTSERTVAQVTGWFAAAGMSPLRVRAEVDGFIADRLMEALWREALWLVHDGVATVSEIDDAMRLGFGLRWAQMGVFQTYATAGGEGGFRHFIEHFGPALQLPWTKLTDVPEMSPEFMATLIAQSDEQSAGQSAAELCAARDRNLVDVMLALEANDWGAGRSLASLRERLAGRS
ncbi:MAG: 3-hydroxyacyl-CoA dehydrogenase NAD-binding domain-containing protein [Acidimicrobiaceae bacterium]|nr:3-hydroxyacyl-CoA dehydrogenase NAD-binding domain-containing protein [Acidimicrobiaceae bacterium]MDE0497103.1 3-hydroxyacyl-CoA dehydrogenase NAD-binding domain-containing protein [Acidimicrobiaceae bacterium]